MRILMAKDENMAKSTYVFTCSRMLEKVKRELRALISEEHISIDFHLRRVTMTAKPSKIVCWAAS